MSVSPNYNILMYSHDTYGLGHIRRSMAIANHLRDANTNVLIITGSPIAGRFPFPEQVDFVRIPGMIKKTNEDYQSLSMRIGQEHALSIRTNIILATAQELKPDLFIVDKEPHGLKREVLPTLEWLKENSPQTTSVLGLRDILDESTVIQKDWQEKGVYQSLDNLYDEIWVYGEQSIYDPTVHYSFPVPARQKTTFTGYIPRKTLSPRIRNKVRNQYRILDDDIFVLVTTGGGGDGCEVVEQYLAMHEYYPTSLPIKSVIITGPFMPKRKRERLKKRAKLHGIKTLPFHPRLEELMKGADLVISMGGYNTICEILTQETPALIIPRETPRREQLIRAICLKERGLLDYISWTDVTPQLLREKIFTMIRERDKYVDTIRSFELTGLDVMLQQLQNLKSNKHTPAPVALAAGHP
ncbi:glycosyltransferase family protein [Desulfopila sp. IMCC35008]|uniref:glycosyltransferase family protein n=1 Tax=Desulfopila sp. IMCC35008 TaxID=2653858 RepID=UPI0013CF7BBC|nr:glycosyltransferase [Desulfopila sp. IMCC35008]